jgi:ribosomal-protein-alanine N-acetyltransferase
VSHTGENPHVVLKETEPGDLETLFVYQLDEEAAYMAAFINENWNDKDAYLAKWNKLLTDKAVNSKTIFLDNKVVGSVLIWQLRGDLQISYGVGKDYWNRGIATSALQQFLAITPERPLYGRIAFDNIGSFNVLTKCGFKKINEEKSYAYARKKEIVEIVLLLNT